MFAGCGAEASPTPVPFRVVTPIDVDPREGGTELRVAIEQVGQADPIAEHSFPVDTSVLSVGPVPYGTGYSFRVDVLAGEFVYAKGRSLPFDILSDAPLAERPDVFLGRVGVFERPTEDPPPDDRVVGGVADASGALLATASGRLYRYRIHDPAPERDGEPSLGVVRQVSIRAGATWAPMGPGRLLAVGGSSAGAILVDSTGLTIAELRTGELENHRVGAAVVSLLGGTSALLLGGAPGSATPASGAVTRIDVQEGETGEITLVTTRLDPLPAPVRDASATSVPVRDEGPCPCERVVVTGGVTASSRGLLVDPDGVDATVTADLGVSLRDSSLVPIDTGLVLVVGGRGTDDVPAADLILLSVRPGALVPIVPRPDPLSAARALPGSARFGDGLALIVGGIGADGAPLSSAEIYEFRPDLLPGDVAWTQSLAMPEASPFVLPMMDRSVLATGTSGAYVYVPPRGR